MQGRIIVIGASADGIAAITYLLSTLPAAFGAPVFIAQHIGPGSAGYLPTLLGRSTTMPVMHPRDGQRIEPGHVYVAPPDHHMLVRPGWIHLSQGAKEHYTRPSVDVLFRSAAVAYGPATVGVVLTGYLTDGTAGLLAIKDRGGVSIVQDPSEAAAPSMPRSALVNVPIDHIVKLRDLGALLVQLVADPPAAPPAVVPSIVLEDRIASGESSPDVLAQLFARGALTTIPCPCCGCALRQLDESRLRRYRCAEGHAFTDASLAVHLSPAARTTGPRGDPASARELHVRPARVQPIREK